MLNVEPRPCGHNEAIADFRFDDKTYTITTSANVPLRSSGTSWLAPATIAAMHGNHELYIHSTVDDVARAGAAKAQRLMASWWPETMHEVPVDATATPDVPASHERGVGSFFSGGLDSFYTAVRHQPEITHLVFVHGFDIFLNNEEYYETTVDRLRKAAAEMGKTLIELRSNIRVLDKETGGWGKAHGAAMVHVAELLSEHVHTMYVPASDCDKNPAADGSHPDLVPHGSHPDLDPLWSSSRVRILQSGVDATRVDKARMVKNSDAAMTHLRVCYWNRNDVRNCGECDKCVRTAINVYVAGAECAALPEIDLVKALDRIPMNKTREVFVQENLAGLREGPVNDARLESALERALRRTWPQRAFARAWNSAVIAKVAALTIREKLTR
ncbi:hypothetical protein [Tomitella gaofuii]|uniref:hypothetical protein n=1 Tax=Tomitella gaofuii TaxID=2760083 RepID=UPI0015F99E11|nr:hypothetical protein [Tomitella gaofuii]